MPKKDQTREKKTPKRRKRPHIAVLNGANLNLLGIREPSLYGAETLADLETRLYALAEELGVRLSFMQSNHEGELVDAIQALRDDCKGLIINAGAYSHTSLAIRDALLAVAVPFVEVHLTNIFARESFRRRSMLADVAVGVIAGFGSSAYDLALGALAKASL